MKNFVLTNIFMLMAVCAGAQTDVSKYFLSNYGFDDNFDYVAGATNNVAQELKEVEGWTADLSADYTIVGTYEFGFKGVFNGASVPAKGYDGEAGGGLAISTGWEQTFLFYQTVTLPAGTYTINVPTYNGSDVKPATSQLAWIPTNGTATRSNITSYPAREWTLDQITFTLTKTTTGKIQFGMKAAAGGSANTAKFVVDYVQILVENMQVDKSQLQAAITSATKYYGDGTGNEADALKAAIDEAQKVADDETADMIQVLEATEALNKAIEAYRNENVSEENPLDYTSYIINPSFENSTNGWTSANLVSQNNSSFPKKAGTYYLEKWTASGSIGDGFVSQVIKDLPNGQYKLTVGAQNGSTTTNNKNTGVVIYAGDQETPVYGPNDYSVKFTSITGEVEIGYRAVNASSNWLAVDNFRLYLIGYVDNDAIIEELGRIITEAEASQTNMMSAAVAKELQEAIDAAKLITKESSEADTRTAVKNLQSAVEKANTSIAEYQALAAQIETVEASYDESKEGAEEFKAEIDKAKELVKNADATSAELAAEIEALDKALLAFNIANATEGTGTAPKVTVTHKYVAMGSTEALVRATSTGSNILERGVCWSTEHNPTVLDNRTTKSFSLNGYIFHIKGLEPATVYYVRPYVMNKTYTVAYGDEIKVVTHPKGTCSGSWNNGAPDEAANTRCRNAINETIEYFNQWTGIKGFHLSGNYGAQTPTADCSYGGSMRIGPNAGNQAIGTVIHETGHGVGVGTSSRWWDKNVHDWRWLGREANDILKFLENSTAENVYMVGDTQHGWGNVASYDWFVNGADKDKHTELQYIGGCVLLYGFFIDGLNPTYSYTNGIAGYTYNFNDDKKYYLMNKSEEGGLGEGLLYQRTSSAIGWKPYLNPDEVTEVSDSAAWYLEYNPQNGYYMFKNAMSGRYLTHAAGGSNVALKNISSSSKPSATEYFQLMPDRTDVTIDTGSKKITTHGYWFTWNSSGDKAMQAGKKGNLNYGTISQATFNYAETPNQQWIIISEDELEQYGMKPSVPTNIGTVTIDDKEVGKTVVGIYTIGGAKLSATQSGINIIRYSDGTSKKIFVK